MLTELPTILCWFAGALPSTTLMNQLEVMHLGYKKTLVQAPHLVSTKVITKEALSAQTTFMVLKTLSWNPYLQSQCLDPPQRTCVLHL